MNKDIAAEAREKIIVLTRKFEDTPEQIDAIIQAVLEKARDEWNEADYTAREKPTAHASEPDIRRHVGWNRADGTASASEREWTVTEETLEPSTISKALITVREVRNPNLTSNKDGGEKE